MRFLQLNLRCVSDSGGNSILRRSVMLVRCTRFYSPDVMCFQECTPVWLFLLRLFLGRSYRIFNFRRGGDAESLCIAAKKRISCTKRGQFMLSDEPDNKCSSCYEVRYGCNRICAYALLHEDATGAEVLTACTHFGFDEEERIKSAELVASYTSRLADAARIICGDLNAEEHSPTYELMCRHFSDAAGKDGSPTYTDYGRAKCPTRIDYIFTEKHMNVQNFHTIQGEEFGYMSDHLGIVCDIENE